MRLIIAGGRNYKSSDIDYEEIDLAVKDTMHEVTEVFSGGASGADKLGEEWARINEIKVRKFLPDWDKHGRAAGPIRNEAMAKEAHTLIIFPGGRGSASMVRLAKKYNLSIYYCGYHG